MDGQFKHSSTEKRSKRLRLCWETDSVEWCKFKILLASVLNANTQTWMHGYYRKQSCSHSNSECACWLQKESTKLYENTHLSTVYGAFIHWPLCGCHLWFLSGSEKTPELNCCSYHLSWEGERKGKKCKSLIGNKATASSLLYTGTGLQRPPCIFIWRSAPPPLSCSCQLLFFS